MLVSNQLLTFGAISVRAGLCQDVSNSKPVNCTVSCCYRLNKFNLQIVCKLQILLVQLSAVTIMQLKRVNIQGKFS